MVGEEYTTLQRFIFPSLEVCSSTDLYFHSNHLACFEFGERRLRLRSLGEVLFDTYFNSLSWAKWAKHASLDSLGVEVECQGEFILRVEENSPYRSSRTLHECVVHSRDISKHHFDLSMKEVPDGTLFLRVICLSDQGIFTGGAFTTRAQPERQVRVGIVITTYNRRSYLLATLDRIRSAIRAEPGLAHAIHTVVVDNASSLALESNEDVTYIPNPNLGGAGGFSRGLQYLRDRGEFTHALFMDDDVSFETEAVRRSIMFASFSRDPNLCIAGSMFVEAERHVQFEAGASFLFESVMPQLRVFGAGLDMGRWENVMRNDAFDRPVGYGAWWFFLFPVGLSGRQLAFPFFLRGDDILFSYLYARKIVTLNGVNVWHAPFEYKDSPTTVYYNQRNWEVVRALAGPPHLSMWPALGYFLWVTLHENLTMRYQMVEYRVRAMRDFLKGPEFWRGLRHDALHRKLRAEDREVAVSLPFDAHAACEPYEYRINRLRTLIQALTLNGHLLPAFVLRRLQARPVRSFSLQERRFSGAFGQQRVVHWYPPTNEGFIVEHSKRRFFRNLAEIAATGLAVGLRYHRVRARYREAYEELSSPEHWAQVRAASTGGGQSSYRPESSDSRPTGRSEAPIQSASQG